MSRLSTPTPPRGRPISDLFTSTPPPQQEAQSDERTFIEHPSNYISPQKQLVPVVPRAERAQAAIDIGSSSESSDDEFEDAVENLDHQKKPFGIDGAQDFQGYLEQQDEPMRYSWDINGLDPVGTQAFDASQISGNVEVHQTGFQPVFSEQDHERSQEAADFPSQGIISEDTNGVEAIEPPEEDAHDGGGSENMFGKYFSSKPTSAEDSEPEEDEDGAVVITSSNGVSTPPLPTPKTKRPKKDPKFAPRLRPGEPDTNLDVSPHLTAHARFHFRAFDYIPRLANHPLALTMPSHRYWIAVLLPPKLPKNVSSEKDFIWMKGNRFSTVKTVWNAYLTTMFADPDDEVLMLGIERVEMGETMEELNYWDDNLVVFRVMAKKGWSEGKRNGEIVKGKSLAEGVDKLPLILEGHGEVIQLDD